MDLYENILIKIINVHISSHLPSAFSIFYTFASSPQIKPYQDEGFFSFNIFQITLYFSIEPSFQLFSNKHSMLSSTILF